MRSRGVKLCLENWGGFAEQVVINLGFERGTRRFVRTAATFLLFGLVPTLFGLFWQLLSILVILVGEKMLSCFSV